MSFCVNCGNELPEGTKFCPNCGAAVGSTGREAVTGAEQQPAADSPEKKVSGSDKHGRFYGIILLVLAVVDFFSDPAIVTILLSAVIIGGCIFCLVRKYKLKGFTIAALILAAYCLFCGIGQAGETGLLKVPEDAEAYSENVEDEAETEATDVTSSPTDGVDPDLKAYLDSYEAFVDEYVVFMKKYTADPNNAVSMLSEYSEIMERYQDFAEKIDAYDTDTMSDADLKYYLEVTTRCSEKMLDIY